jgi:hypothetical protein
LKVDVVAARLTEMANVLSDLNAGVNTAVDPQVRSMIEQSRVMNFSWLTAMLEPLVEETKYATPQSLDLLAVGLGDLFDKLAMSSKAPEFPEILHEISEEVRLFGNNPEEFAKKLSTLIDNTKGVAMVLREFSESSQQGGFLNDFARSIAEGTGLDGLARAAGIDMGEASGLPNVNLPNKGDASS